jgi:hypothetical protein
MLDALYGQSLTLLTDLYQLTMAAAAWKSGIEKREAAFHLVFRRAPYGSGFTIAAGPPGIHASRARTQAQLALLHPAVKRLANPHAVGLHPLLHERRTQMILKARSSGSPPPAPAGPPSR